jgi:hypothetical protein
VAIPCRQVVHVGLKVLDDAVLVCRRKVCSRMCERNCANGGIVGLEDRLEVESQSVPEGELPTR